MEKKNIIYKIKTDKILQDIINDVVRKELQDKVLTDEQYCVDICKFFFVIKKFVIEIKTYLLHELYFKRIGNCSEELKYKNYIENEIKLINIYRIYDINERKEDLINKVKSIYKNTSDSSYLFGYMSEDRDIFRNEDNIKFSNKEWYLLVSECKQEVERIINNIIETKANGKDN